ncbi:MAG TPA: hypothetical protein VIL30_08695, partial [Ramlibacter sp.]
MIDRIGDLALEDLSDDDVHSALEDLAKQPARYYLGKDAEGYNIFKSRHGGARQGWQQGAAWRFGVSFPQVGVKAMYVRGPLARRACARALVAAGAVTRLHYHE